MVFKKIIYTLSNEYLKAMLFGFMIIITTIEYISSFLVRILIYIIAFAIASEPMIKDMDNETKFKEENKWD